ncbi:D-galactarate dehydratase [Synergistales bacterium]|nr:D-galactarate dehydratase [Synergistales bacterium]
MKKFDAHRVAKNDNVAVVVRDVKAGEALTIHSDGAEPLFIVSASDIPAGHKIALADVKNGGDILKYGEIIGAATADIAKGEYVHIHNLEGKRGRGDRA